jgi:drug/metabolite transporter (DMT)-like permease
MDPALLSLLRFLVATPVVVLVMTARGLRLRIRRLGMLILSGLTGIALFNLSLYSSLAYITPATSSLVITASAPITYVIALALGMDRLRWRPALGSAVALLGVYLLLSPHLGLRSWVGIFLALVSAVSWSTYTIVVRRLSGDYSPEELLAWSMIMGTLLLTPTLLFTHLSMLNLWSLISIIYIALVPGVAGYMLWNMGVRRIGASLTSMLLPISPLVASALSVLFLGEALGTDQLIGGALVVIGTLLVLRDQVETRS